MINSIINNQTNTDSLHNLKQQSLKSQANETKPRSSNSDVVEIGTGPLPAVTYSKADLQKADAKNIEALKQVTAGITENLRNYVKNLLLQQGTTNSDKQTNLSGIDDADFGIDAVSDRIVDFAIAISGDDTTKLAELKASIDKGFAEAAKTFGGELPDICNQTYDKIMEKLDQWSQAE